MEKEKKARKKKILAAHEQEKGINLLEPSVMEKDPSVMEKGHSVMEKDFSVMEKNLLVMEKDEGWEIETEMEHKMGKNEVKNNILRFDNEEMSHTSKSISTNISQGEEKVSGEVSTMQDFRKETVYTNKKKMISKTNKEISAKEICKDKPKKKHSKKVISNLGLQEKILSLPVSNPLICDLCKKTFSCKSHLDRHIMCHTDERPFTCEMCDKKFRNKNKLSSHMTIHYYAKPFACDVCDYTCKWKVGLKLHMLKHSDERPFVCTECKKGFRTDYNLKLHLGTHSDERPFTCEVCGKSYKQKRCLSSHMQTHESF